MKVSTQIQNHIIESLKDTIVASGEFHGDFWIQIKGQDLINVVTFLREDEQCLFDSFVDLCGVDYLKRIPRFESVVHLYSTQNKQRIRIRCLVDDNTLTLPTLINQWKGADWQERESYDMYGIKYEGHPNLLRILSPPGTEIFPQRKDYPLTGVRAIDEELET